MNTQSNPYHSMIKTTAFVTTLAVGSLLLAASCKQKDTPGSDSSTKADSSSVSIPASLQLSEEPAGALSIAKARPEIQPGATITISGKVMGHVSPFVSGRAMLILGDPDKLTSCDLKGCGTCETPWDVCCDDPGDIKSYTATVQVLDADGQLVKQGLKGVFGITELSQLVVTGTVADGSNADNLLISASGIYVRP